MEILLKLGIGLTQLDRLNPQLWEAIRKLTSIWPDTDPLIITSTTEATHLPYSFHYSGDAIDIRKPKWWTKKTHTKAQDLLKDSFKLIDEGDHLHLQTTTRRGG